MFCENQTYKNLIGGAWRSSQTNQTISIHSPVDGSLLGTVPAVSRAEVDAIIAIQGNSANPGRRYPSMKKRSCSIRLLHCWKNAPKKSPISL